MVRLIKTSIHDSQILVSQEMEPAARVLWSLIHLEVQELIHFGYEAKN